MRFAEADRALANDELRVTKRREGALVEGEAARQIARGDRDMIDHAGPTSGAKAFTTFS